MRRTTEDGYVLIAAIWLLVLSGAIVAFLLLNNMRLTRQARSDGVMLQDRLALGAAVETIVADRIVNGDRSIWNSAPTERTLEIDGISVRVRSTDETERIDLNGADLTTVDAALRQAGLSTSERQQVLARLSFQRGGGSIKSIVDLDRLLGSFDYREPSRCVSALFSIVPGAQALADKGRTFGANRISQALGSNAAQRLELRATEGSSREFVLRVILRREEPIAVLDNVAAPC